MNLREAFRQIIICFIHLNIIIKYIQYPIKSL